MVPSNYYIILSAMLFTTGVVGLLVRRNPIIMFMSIELMFNSANLAFVTFARHFRDLDGQVIVFVVTAVAAAEVAVGLAIIVTIFRSRKDINVDEMNTMKW
jgi:NADH-quinone oxidoreductase subunit K